MWLPLHSFYSLASPGTLLGLRGERGTAQLHSHRSPNGGLPACLIPASLLGFWEAEHMEVSSLLIHGCGPQGGTSARASPWPYAAAAGTQAVAGDHGSLQRQEPQGAAGSHSTPCHGSPCTCSGWPGTSPCPARGGADGGASPNTQKAELVHQAPLLQHQKTGPSFGMIINLLLDLGKVPLLSDPQDFHL